MLSFVVLLATLSFSHSADANCVPGEQGLGLSGFLESCPPLLYPSKKYCCPLSNGKEGYCCDAQEFSYKAVYDFLIPAISISGVILLLIICCVCCLCCSCCPWYRRRHRGEVYGQVRPPTVVQVIQPQVRVPTQPPAYPVQGMPMSMPMPNVEPPPSYTSEAYVKQPAYNPNYRQ